MTESTDNQISIDADELLLMLRRKEGNWVEWGKACQQLQKSGHNPQVIFEATGFEPIHQNQIIVGAQVFESMMSVGIAPATQAHYQRIGSDSLYELRILSSEDRAATADYLCSRNMDSEGAKEVAKAFKEFSYMRQPPEGFSHHPGDAVAYQYWRYIKQKNDMTEKTRLIARGLMFAHTQSARNQIEKLLADLTAPPQRKAPTLPVYRLDADEELPRTLPVVGAFPLPTSSLATAPKVESRGAFQITSNNWNGGWISLPGWQILCKAIDPVAVLADEEHFPLKILSAHSKEIVLVLDRSVTQWDEFNYFAFDRDGQLAIEWFDAAPSFPLLGKLLLILQPKSPLENGHVEQDIWEMDD